VPVRGLIPCWKQHTKGQWLAWMAARLRWVLNARYVVKILSTLGGSASVGEAITSTDWISGAANLKGDTIQHATVWRNLQITDLSTLGGPNSRGGTNNSQGLVIGGSSFLSPGLCCLWQTLGSSHLR
jgi:uncharacterized membrane protein